MIVAPLWIRNDDNVGTLARTCEAVGAELVVSNDRHVAVRRGNTSRYPALYLDPGDVKRWIKHQLSVRPVYAVETGGDPLSSYTPQSDCVLLLGSENTGIPDWALELATDIVTLPSIGKSPCVNVAVAGSMAAYYFAGAFTS